MKISRIVTVVLLSLITLVGYSQQQAQYSQFMVNPYLVNPALSGAENFLDIKMGFRRQWSGFGNGNASPTTMYFSGHTPIGKPQVAQTHKGDYHNWHGVGLIVYQDRLGLYNATNVNANGETTEKKGSFTNTYAALNYAYNMKITEGKGFNTYHKDGMRLSLGAFIGMSMLRLQYDGFLLPNEVREDIPFETDPTADRFSNNPSANLFDVSFGGLLYLREIFYVGLSTFQTLGNSYRFAENSNLARHYYLSAAYKLEFQDHFYFWPSVLMKTIGGITSFDLNARLDYHDQFFGGISFRMGNGTQFTNSAVTLMAGTLIEIVEGNKGFRRGKHRYGIELYYSYDITTLGQQFSQFEGGSHEITLGFRLPPMLIERNAEDTW